MWKVERPQMTAAQSFAACVSGVRNEDLRKRLTSVAPLITQAETVYEQCAQARTLNLVANSKSVGGLVTKEEMIRLYEGRMVGKNSPGRPIYEKLKMLPKGDRCPFCGQRNISTLDHILPKADYPDLTVTPINLVGCCAECNKAKLAHASTAPDATALHPYFDDLSNQQWLKARVIPESGCPTIFFVIPPATWDHLTRARMMAQFDRLELSYLYSSQAAREIANIAYNLKTYLDVDGVTGVQAELVRQWHSRYANSVNSWHTALYEALAGDAWFCSGGFGTLVTQAA